MTAEEPRRRAVRLMSASEIAERPAVAEHVERHEADRKAYLMRVALRALRNRRR
jgi:hypothetical protein